MSVHLTKLVLCSRLWTDAPAKTWCVKWHHLPASFSAQLLIKNIQIDITAAV